jgi:protein AFG1
MKPLGAGDYMEICKNFDVVLLRDVPRMSLERRSEARRFITLIDTFYDQKVRVIFSAECLPADLFDTAQKSSEYDQHHARVLIGDLHIKQGDSNENASLFTGEEELFAFDRAISRITEMQSAAYWTHAAEHRKH